jgi:hypothetical protein
VGGAGELVGAGADLEHGLLNAGRAGEAGHGRGRAAVAVADLAGVGAPVTPEALRRA